MSVQRTPLPLRARIAQFANGGLVVRERCGLRGLPRFAPEYCVGNTGM